jgi:hypothetical protein
MKTTMFLAMMFFSGVVWAAEVPAIDDSNCLPGRVLQTNDVDVYTYILLQTPDGETWAAVDKAKVETGGEIAIVHATVMKDFWSRSQNRTYEWIVFGSLAKSCEAPANPDSAMAAQSEMAMAAHRAAGVTVGAAVPATAGPVQVAKAEGPAGRTVAEVVADAAILADNRVAVRGRVARYTADVMGKNWIHLQDGSGSAGDGTNDILVTTFAQANIGDVVLVKGVVHTNRDFGAGYAYKVLIEEATLDR